MLKQTTLLFASCLVLAACAQAQPRIIQPAADAAEIRLEGGMATQVELPAGSRVESVVVGNPDLVGVERDNDVVNLMPKNKSGDTNLIVRAVDSSGDTEVYQYRITVLGH